MSTVITFNKVVFTWIDPEGPITNCTVERMTGTTFEPDTDNLIA